MKKIVISIFSALLSLGLYAQTTKDYAYCCYQIDSLTNVYSVDSLTNAVKIRTGLPFQNAKLNEKDKGKLIDKIRKLFEQKKYFNLYVLGSELISQLYFQQWKDDSGEWQGSSVKIQQMLMDLYLQYYFYPMMNNSLLRRNHIESKDNYSRTGKKRLIELLEDKKTEEEYQLYVNYNKSYYSARSEALFREASYIIRTREVRNDTVLAQIKDSLFTAYVFSDAKRELESQRIENELIRMIGFMDMKECIPILQRKLQENILEHREWREPEKSYRCALARLGDKEQRQYILDSLMDIEEFDRNDFIYFQDDEMIWKYIDVNYFSDKNIPVFSSVYLPSSFMTINNIYPYIKNLPKELEYPKDDKERKIRFAWAESVHNWLITNKKTVVFDYAGEKDFEW